MNYIDLHSHTVHSDGVCSVAEVLTCAEEAGLSLFSFSDHNSVGAYGELADCRRLFSGKILPACEFSAGYRGDLVEVLGYGIDPAQTARYVAEQYLPLEQKRVAEAKLVGETLAAKGAILSKEFLQLMCTEPERIDGFLQYGCRPLYLEEMQKYKENICFFESEEEFYTMTRHRWYRQYLANPNSVLYVDQTSFCPSLADVTAEIHRQGGLAFLAHLFVYSDGVVAALDDISARYGLDGLECHYGTFTEQQKTFLCDYCDQYGLFKSGGSDYHGLSFRPENHMGRSADRKIEFSLVEPWFEKVKDRLI